MTGFLVAFSVWLMAIPTSWSVHAARALQILALAIAILEHHQMFLTFRFNLKITVMIAFVVVAALGAGVFAHGFGGVVLSDAGRQIYALAFVFVLAQYFRSPALLRDFVRWFVLFGAATLIVGVFLILGKAGIHNMFNYAALKDAKYALTTDGTVALNSLAYSVGIAALLGMGMQGEHPMVRYFSAMGLVAASWMLGSTTTAIAVVFAGLLTMLLWWVISKTGTKPVLAAVVLVTIWFIGHFIAIAVALEVPWVVDFINEATTGRYYLWIVALGEFMSNPIYGAGPFSWETKLLSGVSQLTGNLSRYEQLAAGAYHNVLFTVLAERGLIGGGALTLLLVYIVSVCGTLARATKLRTASATFMDLVPLKVGVLVWVVLTTIMRGAGETSGPVAYARSHADFVALTVVAILIGVAAQYSHFSARRRKVVPNVGWHAG